MIKEESSHLGGRTLKSQKRLQPSRGNEHVGEKDG